VFDRSSQLKLKLKRKWRQRSANVVMVLFKLNNLLLLVSLKIHCRTTNSCTCIMIVLSWFSSDKNLLQLDVFGMGFHLIIIRWNNWLLRQSCLSVCMLHSRQPLQFELLNLQRPSPNDLVMTPGVFKVLELLSKPLTLVRINMSEWVLSLVKVNWINWPAPNVHCNVFLLGV